ncbi:MAG: 16S rRNA (cytosine(1402)-N(4))-methyltransferase RsmH [Chitinispirillales bacterium]|jgi:16S rRNA (cytosine1402-N4)-methyltransferase|nr:16S rRNA (cytosine(1402)-N(4))-methyltransferase RsmH [Chitinispirillales bacterium]
MSGAEYHVPVLLEEVLKLFVDGDGVTVSSPNSGANGGTSAGNGTVTPSSIKNGRRVYVDGTLGGGGHFRAIVDALSRGGWAENAVVIGIDRDREAVENARRVDFGEVKPRIIIEQARFSEFDFVLDAYNIERVDGLFVDLGVSSRQIDVPERGFMYMKDAPLDMRMDQGGGVTAAEFLERSDEGELASVFEMYGEIRNARRMAGVIKGYMRNKKILTSADLWDCVKREYGANVKIQVVAKLFQALRIAVNGEFEELRTFLDKSINRLAEGGKIAIISYHSLEDRMVKDFFRTAEEACVCPLGHPVCICDKTVLLKRVNRKAVMASAEEIRRNPRSRSARLRVAERMSY